MTKSEIAGLSVITIIILGCIIMGIMLTIKCIIVSVFIVGIILSIKDKNK